MIGTVTRGPLTGVAAIVVRILDFDSVKVRIYDPKLWENAWVSLEFVDRRIPIPEWEEI